MKRAALLVQATVCAVVLAASLFGAMRASAQYTPYTPYTPPTYQPYHYTPYQPSYQPQGYQPWQPPTYQPYQPYHYTPYHSGSSSSDNSNDTSQQSNTWHPWTPPTPPVQHSYQPYQPPTTSFVPPYHSFAMDPPYAPGSGPQYHYQRDQNGQGEIVGPNGPIYHSGLTPVDPNLHSGVTPFAPPPLPGTSNKPMFVDKLPPSLLNDRKEMERIHKENEDGPPGPYGGATPGDFVGYQGP